MKSMWLVTLEDIPTGEVHPTYKWIVGIETHPMGADEVASAVQAIKAAVNKHFEMDNGLPLESDNQQLNVEFMDFEHRGEFMDLNVGMIGEYQIHNL